MDPRALVERAIRCEEEGRLDDAVPAWIAIAGLIPNQPLAYQHLFKLHVHRREVDAAFCAASVLASLDALEGMARELYDDYVPRRAAPHVAGPRLDEEGWALLRHPTEDSAVGERLAALLPKMKLRPAHTHAIDVATLEWAATLFGASPPDLPRDDAPSNVAGAELDEVWGNYTLRERLFFAGRAATVYRVPVHILEDATKRTIAEALGASLGEEIDRWLAAVRVTRACAGMLVCGEPSVARDLLTREKVDDATLGLVTLFAVSPNHHRLRAKLGIAIGATADAPVATSPTHDLATTPSVVRSPPLRSPPPSPSLPALVAMMDAAIQPPEPPKTVRDLERALRLALTDAHLARAVVPGELVLRDDLPAPLARVLLKWRGATTPRSAEALRGRALEGWSIELAEGRRYVDARLCARFGLPRDLEMGQHFASKHGVFVLSWHAQQAPLGETCRLEFRPSDEEAAVTS